MHLRLNLKKKPAIVTFPRSILQEEDSIVLLNLRGNTLIKLQGLLLYDACDTHTVLLRPQLPSQLHCRSTSF